MGIFNFFKPKKNDSEIIKKLFPNLKGIHFESISTTPKGDSPEKFFNSDIDGKWFFSVHNFAMIFKSFSDENYEKSLSELIDSNGIDLNSMKEESSHYYFEGDGFKIEKPKYPGLNLIIISNEDWTRTDVVKLKSFDQLNEVQVEWISGIDKIYEGEDALSRFNLSKDLKNVVMYFKEEDSDYLLIHIPTSNVAKSIINQIIDKNKKEDEFVKVNDEGEWENLHENNNIVIGYLPKHQAVRINHKKSDDMDFDEEYLKIDQMLMSIDSYKKEYPFLKDFREKLKAGDIFLEDMDSYIKNQYGSLDGPEIMYTISLFEQIEHILAIHLNEWEENNDNVYKGFVDIEQYHSLSQKTIISLREMLTNKISDLGKN